MNTKKNKFLIGTLKAFNTISGKNKFIKEYEDIAKELVRAYKKAKGSAYKQSMIQNAVDEITLVKKMTPESGSFEFSNVNPHIMSKRKLKERVELGRVYLEDLGIRR